MKAVYSFYINDSDKLCCRCIYNGNEEMYSPNKTSAVLKKIDSYNFDKVIIKERSIKLTGEEIILNFYDIDEVLENGLLKQTDNILNQIVNELDKKADKKYKNKKIVKSNSFKKATITGALALILSTTALSSINKNDKVEEVVVVSENKMSENKNDEVYVQEETEAYNEVLNFDEDKNNCVINYEFPSNRYSETGEYAYQEYSSIVKKYSNKWGISENLPMALLTQESAGKVDNLMQIESRFWLDYVFNAYDYQNNCNCKLVITNNPEKYYEQDVVCIRENEINNPETNISIGILILRESIKMFKGNLSAGIQAYNYGYSNVLELYKCASLQSGLSIDELINDYSNLDFMNYTSIIKGGDPEYLRHVMQYVESPEDGIFLKCLDNENNISEYKYSYKNNEKMIER